MGIDTLVQQLVAWARAIERVDGVVLVGSRARGTARKDSDVDLVVLTEAPATFLKTTLWTHAFGEPARIDREDCGVVQSVRVHYDDGLEVEFGFARPDWARTDVVDPATAEVIRDGARILADKHGRLGHLLRVVNEAETRNPEAR